MDKKPTAIPYHAEKAIENLLKEKKVTAPVVQKTASCSFLHFIRDKNDYKNEIVHMYGENVYPREIVNKTGVKEVKAQSDLFVSADDLRHQMLHDQIQDMKLKNNDHYFCINLSNVPKDELEIYRDNILSAVDPEYLEHNRVKVICSDQAEANRLSTEKLICAFI